MLMINPKLPSLDTRFSLKMETLLHNGEHNLGARSK